MANWRCFNIHGLNCYPVLDRAVFGKVVSIAQPNVAVWLSLGFSAVYVHRCEPVDEQVHTCEPYTAFMAKERNMGPGEKVPVAALLVNLRK